MRLFPGTQLGTFFNILHMEPVEVIELKDNKKLMIIQDENPESPREWDNLGTMACFHRRYSLGDRNIPFSSGEFSSWSEMESHIWNQLDAAIVIPIYMYDHSGITISTSPFSCPWDSGQIGFMYVTRDKLRKEYNVKRLSEKIIQKAEKVLYSEVETYDQYLTGDVYGFKVMEYSTCDKNHTHGDVIDSCWGFYGSDYKTNGMLDHIDSKLLPIDAL